MKNKILVHFFRHYKTGIKKKGFALYEPFDLRILIQKIIDSDISTILHSRVLPYYRNEQAGYHFHQSKIY